MEARVLSPFLASPSSCIKSSIDPNPNTASVNLFKDGRDSLKYIKNNSTISTPVICNDKSQQGPSSSLPILNDDSARPSHVSLLGGKYLLFSSPANSQGSVSPSGVKSFQRCINVESREQFTCKVVPRNVTGLSLLAAYYRMEEACDFICRAHEVVLSPKSFYLIMPISHSNLHAYLLGKKQLTEVEGAKIFKQMVQAVQFCHDKGIVLRDLKMGKFVFTDTERTVVKLESLEDSVLLHKHSDDRLSDKHGCPNYVSPEKAETLRSNKTYPGKATDVWGLGVILYTMLVGRYPFHETDNSKLFSKIRKGDYTIPNYVSEPAKNLIRHILNKNPNERFDCAKILTHRWLLNNEAYDGYKNSMDPFHFEKELYTTERAMCNDQVVPDFNM